MYQYSEIPERLPGGGGWGIKVFSLDALYSDHEYARNCWTKTNHDYPLCRYIGCRLKFFQSEYTDYIVTYTNQLPMKSSLGMYNSMQPSIHNLQQHRLNIPSIHTYKKKKPYKSVWIPPPPPLQNKWYFQADMAKTPLLMLRTSATSFNKYFIDPDTISNNLTISSLNAGIFQNRDFAHPTSGTKTGYWAYVTGGKTVYLYASRQEPQTNSPKAKNIICLYDTLNYTEGSAFSDTQTGNTWGSWKTNKLWWTNAGNPFHTAYLQDDITVYQCPQHMEEIMTNKNPEDNVDNFTIVKFIKKLRYNPETDQTHDHITYFKSNKKAETGWEPPDNEELTNEGLPFWLMLWGFCDWHRKIKKHQHLDSDYILTIKQHVTTITRDYIIPLSDSFIRGHSPYYKEEPYQSEIDKKTWYPQLQYQTEAINDICLTGPGVPRIPENYSVQGLVKYCFYFKWGGDLPQMSTIENPRALPTFILPGNQYSSTSLQNPTTNPAGLLYSFDERRHTLTKTALKRLQTYQQTKTTSITDGSPFQEEADIPQTQTSESSEEEKEETLFEQLQQQRRKQQRLKQRILLTLQQIQQLE